MGRSLAVRYQEEKVPTLCGLAERFEQGFCLFKIHGSLDDPRSCLGALEHVGTRLGGRRANLLAEIVRRDRFALSAGAASILIFRRCYPSCIGQEVPLCLFFGFTTKVTHQALPRFRTALIRHRFLFGTTQATIPSSLRQTRFRGNAAVDGCRGHCQPLADDGARGFR